MIDALLALFERVQTGKNRVLAEQLFDAKQLVVFRSAIGTAERTGLDLTAVRGHRDVRDGRVFGFAGAMREDGRVSVRLCQRDRVERLRERTDLVHFHED